MTHILAFVLGLGAGIFFTSPAPWAADGRAWLKRQTWDRLKRSA